MTYFSVAAAIALLRWNSTGITIAGMVGVMGNASNQLNGPFGLVVNLFNTLYVADSGNSRIEKWTMGASNGMTVAGQADGTRGNSASYLNSPGAVALDSSDNIYVANSYNHRIQFYTNGASLGTTVAGISGRKLYLKISAKNWKNKRVSDWS
jgi:hypothetical protein